MLIRETSYVRLSLQDQLNEQLLLTSSPGIVFQAERHCSKSRAWLPYTWARASHRGSRDVFQPGEYLHNLSAVRTHSRVSHETSTQ